MAKLDETHLLIDSIERDVPMRKAWVFDIVDQTVAPADPGQAAMGIIIGIGGRTGFMRRSDSVWFGDTVSACDPVALAQLTADRDLEVQLAKLKVQSKGIGIGPAGGAAMMTGGLIPGLSGVPLDAQIHVVGVYEGSGDTRMTVAGRRVRDVASI